MTTICPKMRAAISPAMLAKVQASFAVYRALKIDLREPSAAYATEPFTVLSIDEKNWIAGAVGHHAGLRYGDWHPTGDVILWNPRTGETRLRGDIGPALIVPFHPEPRLPVYTDGFAFFRAWADNRAAIYTRQSIAAEMHKTTNADPRDSGIPGALAIGDLNKIDWFNTGATVLAATPGLDPKALNRAVIRSARLPRVESLAA
jgi:hypothetical protein